MSRVAAGRPAGGACSACDHPYPTRPIGKYLLCCFCVADLSQLLTVFSPAHMLMYPLCEGHVTALGWLIPFYRKLDRVA